MGEKDITEKTLIAYNDVFADIVNVLLFGGKRVIKPDSLLDAAPVSMYKSDDGKLHEQERDVSKYWVKGNVKLAMTGIENQTSPEADMPLRVIAYDGASYRSELIGEKAVQKYPVVTMVLYYGTKRWNKPVNLTDCFITPNELKSYVNEYTINLFEIAFFNEKTVQLFQSDFKVVADYFVQKRKYKDYIPSEVVIKHVDEVLKLMSVFVDDKFAIVSEELSDMEKENITMCEIVDRFVAQGIARGENKRDIEYKAALELKESGNTNIEDYREKGISDDVIKIVLKLDKLD